MLKIGLTKLDQSVKSNIKYPSKRFVQGLKTCLRHLEIKAVVTVRLCLIGIYALAKNPVQALDWTHIEKPSINIKGLGEGTDFPMGINGLFNMSRIINPVSDMASRSDSGRCFRLARLTLGENFAKTLVFSNNFLHGAGVTAVIRVVNFGKLMKLAF